MHGEISKVVVLPRIVGEQCVVAVESSLQSMASGVAVVLGSPLVLRRSRQCPVVSVGGVVAARESTILCAPPGGALRVQLMMVLCRS